MTRDIQLLGIVGSLRRDSVNRRLMSVASDVGGPIELFGRLKEIPPFDEDDESTGPDAVLELRARINAAGAILIATPEYNGSVPGQLKNAIDWASRPHVASALRGKPVAVIGASPSPGGARTAVADAQRILTRAGATVIAESASVPRAFKRIGDPDVRVSIAEITTALIAATRDGETLSAPVR